MVNKGLKKLLYSKNPRNIEKQKDYSTEEKDNKKKQRTRIYLCAAIYRFLSLMVIGTCTQS
jgi:hypothetical protein